MIPSIALTFLALAAAVAIMFLILVLFINSSLPVKWSLDRSKIEKIIPILLVSMMFALIVSAVVAIYHCFNLSSL